MDLASAFQADELSNGAAARPELESKPIPLIDTTVPAEPLAGLNPVIDKVGVKL